MIKRIDNFPFFQSDVLLGFEPHFDKDVVVAIINNNTKTIRPTHGYYPPHKHGKASKKYAETIGYEFIC